MGVIETLKFVYELSVEDRATKPLMAAERTLRSSVVQSTRSLSQRDAAQKRSAAVATSSASRVSRAASSNVAAVNRETAAVRRHATAVERVAATSRRAATARAREARTMAAPAARAPRAPAERPSVVGRVAGRAVAAGGGIYGAARLAGFIGREYTEAARLQKVIAQGIKSTGGAAKVTAGHVERMSAALSRQSGIDDEIIGKGASVMLTFTKIRNEAGAGNKIFDRANQAALDLSVRFDKDLSSSALMVGKALNDPLRGLTALGKAGVQFTAQQKTQIATMVKSGDTLGAQTMILRELEGQVGGSAEANRQPVDRLRTSVGNLAESVGTDLAPTVNRAADSLADFVDELVTGTGGGGRFAARMKDVSRDLKPVAGGLVSVGKFLAEHPRLVVAAAGSYAAFRTARGAVKIVDDLRKMRETIVATRDAAASSKIATHLASSAKGAAGKMRNALRSVKGVITSMMRSAGTSGGAVAAENLARSTGTGIGPSLDRHQKAITGGKSGGRWSRYGKVAGRAFGAAVIVGALVGVAGIGAEVTKKIKEELDKRGLWKPPGGKGSFWDNLVPERLLPEIRPGEGLIGKIFRPKRRGGVVEHARRFQGGGLVPIVASGGEVLVDRGRAALITGPSDRDATPLLARPGSAVLTGDGQARMAMGASLAEAIRSQAPHFRKGGHISPGGMATLAYQAGVRPAAKAIRMGAIGMRESRGDPSAHNYDPPRDDSWGLWQINVLPNANPRFKKWKLTNPRVNAKAMAILHKAAGERPWGGYPESSFSGWLDDARKGFKRSGTVAGATGGAGTASGSRDRRVPIVLGRGRRRAGLLEDAFAQGRAAGQAGLTRGRIKREGNPILRAIADARGATTRVIAGRDTSAGAGPGARGGASSAIRPGGGWAGTENIVRAAIRGLGHATFKRPANHPLSIKNPNSDHNMAIKNAFAADLPPGDGIFNTLRKRLGIAAQKGSWNKFAHKPLKGFRTQLLWHAPDGSHRDHNHLGVRRMRAGGIVGRYRIGGNVGAGRALTTGLKRAMSNAGGSLEALDTIIGRAMEQRLLALRKQVDATQKRGGPAAVVQRLRSVLDLIDHELGRRVGRAEDVVEQRIAKLERGRGAVERMMRAPDALKRGPLRDRLREIRPDSVQGLGVLGAQQAAETGVRQQNVATLQKALRTATRRRNHEAIRDLTGKLHEAQDELHESMVRQVELARDRVRAIGAEAVDRAQFNTSYMQGGMASLEAGQRLARTQDTVGGMHQRADYIQRGIIPYLQQQAGAAMFNADRLAEIGDVNGWRQAILDAQAATNDLANAQADAADLMREAAARAAQDMVDVVTHRGNLIGYEQQRLELEQRLLGTYESAGGAQGRADFIRQQILPAIQAELNALIAQQATAQQTGDTVLARQIAEAIAAKTNDSLQAQIDARDTLKDMAGDLKAFAGTSAFSYRDQVYRDNDVDVIAARLGA